MPSYIPILLLFPGFLILPSNHLNEPDRDEAENYLMPEYGHLVEENLSPNYRLLLSGLRPLIYEDFDNINNRDYVNHDGSVIDELNQLARETPLIYYDQSLSNHRNKRISLNSAKESLSAGPSGLIANVRTLDCNEMIKSQGKYLYKTSPENAAKVCTTYLIAPLDHVIRITLMAFNVNCKNGGSLFLIDGWEMKNEFFPSLADTGYDLDQVKGHCHPLQDIDETNNVFQSSQNVAQILFRVPGQGEGFVFELQTYKNPKPCNAVAVSPFGRHTLSNHGERRNCSLSMIYPEKIIVTNLHVGTPPPVVVPKCPKGLINGCANTPARQSILLGSGYGISRRQNRDNKIRRLKMGMQGKGMPRYTIRKRSSFENFKKRRSLTMNDHKSVGVQCVKGGKEDYAEFKEGESLDPLKMHTLIDMCGINPSLDIQVNLKREHSVVRLVSSGEYNNSITFQHEILDPAKI